MEEKTTNGSIPQSEQLGKPIEGLFGGKLADVYEMLQTTTDNAALIEILFVPETLDTLNELEADNPGGYMQIRLACQSKKIPVGKLEAAMAARKKAVERAQAEEAAKQRRQQFYTVQGGMDLPLPAGCAIPAGYHAEPGKTAKIDPEMGPITIAPAGLAILERFCDIDTERTHVQIGAWFPGAKAWHTVDVPRQTIANTTQIVGIADFDFPINTLNAKSVVEYLAQFETKNRQAIPTQQTSGHLGWQVSHGRALGFLAGPKTWIGLTPGEDVRFLPTNPGDGQVVEGFTSAGDVDAWIHEVGLPILCYPKAAVGLLASFAVPLLKVLHHPNFVVDYAGLTSQGKTTAQRVAGGVWGNVDESEPERNVIQSWNVTQVGASEMGRILSGLPLIMDDSKTARNAQSVAETLYLVTNGKGRSKGAKDGGMKAAPTVKTILISSGEKPITRFTQDGGIRTRVLLVEGSPFGAVDDASRQMVQALMNACVDHYGVAGPAFMKWVMDHLADGWKGWTQDYRAAKERYTRQAKTAGKGRLMAHRAFLETAGTLVGQALPDMASGIQTLLQSPDWDALWTDMTAQAGDPLDAQLAMEQLGSWMQAHIELFEGQRSPESFAPSEWLGKWDDKGIAVFHHAVDRQLQEWGYDPQAIVAQWRAKGWLRLGEGRYLNPKITIMGQRGHNAYVLSDAGKTIALASSESTTWDDDAEVVRQDQEDMAYPF
ncbi:MAG: hypothetical protein C7B46_19865 [Sulfobacillus benefaciens]|uniref:DUF927 domain-containing protein n=1 Tax=Sulfobacillus benefaciens TaxID=453960 RepID=A0A2T2WWG3_9FIRM|nr:MAG: hypothetical protein C7B46_19865 [Sulfobacillus benefaciens]